MVTKTGQNVRIGPKKPQRIYLREWRGDLTQEALAERVGVSKATISRWEAWGSGERNQKLAREPNSGALEAIAEALGRQSAADLYYHPSRGGALWSIINNIPENRQEEAARILQVLQKAS